MNSFYGEMNNIVWGRFKPNLSQVIELKLWLKFGSNQSEHQAELAQFF